MYVNVLGWLAIYYRQVIREVIANEGSELKWKFTELVVVSKFYYSKQFNYSEE